jgi:hypothetical protein
MSALQTLAGQLEQEAGQLAERDADRLRGIADVIRRRIKAL